MIKSLIASLVLVVFLAPAVPMALAQIQQPDQVINLPAPDQTGITDTGTIFDSICTVLNYVFTALIILAILFVLIAAFKYLTAGGDPEKVKAASKTLIFAAVAVAVGILAQAIPIIVGNFIGAGGGFQVCAG
jgi:hypothetical protein